VVGTAGLVVGTTVVDTTGVVVDGSARVSEGDELSSSLAQAAAANNRAEHMATETNVR